ncbi:tRNA (adenosine(37)-N6)-threonylcarbamoyltransferase complex dimerization subunit type 1 TsaB [Parasphingorhabdus litoris]|uniref:tRNA (Adenosine(37)-N6)-threonylcarbamoyltransferase complex dimerization subunit type 1 TsaB n=1 Tax=Parasphingorhabdus litoris TaxID=394733 RepID=A0ABN1A8B0_9SPHN|nr:tRNA (adenosine(37)-N6)-threonylcarbamoyltransferase complex dimerization subunit type 1 TsaB [Parasphingorhabdus litoris]
MGKHILAIDTATTACSVALFEDRQLVANIYEEIGRGHAEKLIPMIARLPNKGRADQIMVNCGPGSFTGVRIGLSAAKALAMAWHAEISGYQSLHLVAAQALTEMEHPIPVYVAMIGGHGEYFVQNFSSDGSPVDDLLSLSPELALRNAKSDHFAGSAAQSLSSLASNIGCSAILPDAAKTSQLAHDYEYLQARPVYGRAPDAKPAQQG